MLVCSMPEESATRPEAATKAVIASTTGSTAATSAPNATSRMPRASGTAVHSARAKSSVNWSLNHLPALASPNSSTSSSGCCFCTAATASITAGTFSTAFSRSSPASVNCSRAECRSADIAPVSYGLCSSPTLPVPRTAAETCSTTALNEASSAASAPLCTRTVSPAGDLMPASSRILAARATWPGIDSESVTLVEPCTPPR